MEHQSSPHDPSSALMQVCGGTPLIGRDGSPGPMALCSLSLLAIGESGADFTGACERRLTLRP
eukprot:CAMPEP_0197901048 /NCGR_PEP_ID=MMETSP1439-20131203/50583_1 /TAXON_ID=66791 /ORGANISM="Gonyaulax spinifera, Strain CCMP409" /LENGTH=62 /DNA_ID=CAMNT_0043521999 /DNA_START=122 /DNA_END=306 /DNA_ORIENTATION=-